MTVAVKKNNKKDSNSNNKFTSQIDADKFFCLFVCFQNIQNSLGSPETLIKKYKNSCLADVTVSY